MSLCFHLRPVRVISSSVVGPMCACSGSVIAMEVVGRGLGSMCVSSGSAVLMVLVGPVHESAGSVIGMESACPMCASSGLVTCSELVGPVSMNSDSAILSVTVMECVRRLGTGLLMDGCVTKASS